MTSGNQQDGGTENKQLEKAPEYYFSLFGLTIVRKADILAATAFVLSLTTLIYQVWGISNGADIRVFPPERIVIFIDRLPDDQQFVRIAGALTITNGGQSGQNGIIRRVLVDVKIDNRTISIQHWISFVKIKRVYTTLEVEPLEMAHPLLVQGGSAASHLIGFNPMTEGCDPADNCVGNVVRWQDLIDRLLLNEGKNLTFLFRFRIAGRAREFVKKCAATISPDLVQAMVRDGWFLAPCIE